jgi:Cu-Zn family superoxide dismutase
MPRNYALIALACMSGALVGCGEGAPPEDEPTLAAMPTVIPLPQSVTFPEGIAYDAATGTLYTGSAADGTLIRVDAATGEVSEVIPARGIVSEEAAFPAVLGMEFDSQERIWIAGGRTGKILVVNSRDGALLADLTVPTSGSLINDVAVIGSSAYFSDTLVPTLWRVAEEGGTFGAPEPWLDLSGTPIAYADGLNLNGITATPDGSTLIVVHMDAGLLYAIDVATKEVRPIDTGGEILSGADGLVLDGNTLYVIRQTAVEIATLELNEGMTQATVVSRFTDPALAWPATAALVGDELVVVNTQFNTRQDSTTTLPFTLLRIPLSLLPGAE